MFDEKRIIGDIENINPKYEDCKLLYVTTETYRDESNSLKSCPSFWLDYKGVLYHCICEYIMHPFEVFEDWKMESKDVFNQFFPGEEEFDFLIELNPTFYKVIFSRIKDHLDNFSEWELDLCKPYERNEKINNILE